MPKLTTQEAHLLNQLADLNESRLAAGYGPLPLNIDASMLAAIKRVQSDRRGRVIRSAAKRSHRAMTG